MDIDLAVWLKSKIGSKLKSTQWTVEPISEGTVRIKNAADDVVSISTDRKDPASRISVGVATVDGKSESTDGMYEVDALAEEASTERVTRAVTNGLGLHRLQKIEKKRSAHAERHEYEISQLIEIGKSFSAVHNVDDLLDLILKKARLLVGADGGSIYVVEGDGEAITDRQLRFKLSQNDSIDYDSEEHVIAVSTDSIAGAAAIMRQSINISDARKIPQDAPYQFDPTWDQRFGYSTRSVLAVPMINLSNEVVGVVQLINKKRNPTEKLAEPASFDREVIEMDLHSQTLVETLASQAGVAMENTFLYAEIQRIFQGFIRASVHAIEQRDPTTSGHSLRVSKLTRRLAEVVHDAESGNYNKIRFSASDLEEIEIAALLHDFGKVGVRESILVKAKKLYPPNLKMIRSRFDFVRRSIENDYLHRRLMMVEQGTPTEELAILDQSSERAVAEIESCWRVIWSANEPTVMPEGDFDRIEDIAKRSYFDVGGNRQPYLKDEEVEALKVAKGSLTEEEFEEIRSHVQHTISFLEQIPWGKSLKNVPLYASAHHEKLNGKGYPYGLQSDAIPIPSKIMAVADIFDALTAKDRPYKKAVPIDQALHILELEAQSQHIDAELVQIFREAEVYNVLNKS